MFNSALPWIVTVALFSGIAWTVFGSFIHSEPYELGLRAVQEDRRAIEMLGSPIEAGWLVLGQIQTNGSLGVASLHFPVQGSKSKGHVRVEAIRSMRHWKLTGLQLQANGRQIDLTPIAPLQRVQ
jgi:hypothetical protein